MAGCLLALIGWPHIKSALLRSVRSRVNGLTAVVTLYIVLHNNWMSFQAMLWFGIGAESLLLAYLVIFSVQNAGGMERSPAE